jgi:hypothetical protein
LGEIVMDKDGRESLVEIREMLKLLVQDSKKMLESLNEIRDEQKKLQEEIKIQNIVLNSLPIRTEIIN